MKRRHLGFCAHSGWTAVVAGSPGKPVVLERRRIETADTERGTIGNVSEARYFVRVLAAADIHGALNVYEWLVELAKEHAELVVLAGDLFAGDWEEGLRRQAQQIIAMLKRAGVPCFYIMGNDDNVSLEHEDEQIKPLHGRRLYCGIHGFVGYQFTPPFVGNAFVKPESEIEKDLQSLEPLLYERAVLVTHAPAYGALDQSFGGEHVGSRSLAALLDRRPVLAHIHGHIHGSFGRDGDHFNVASAGQRRAIVVDLPSLNHEILSAGSASEVWLSLAGFSRCKIMWF